MEITIWLQLGLFVALLGLSAFFSSSETSLFSLSSVQLQQMRQEKNPRLNLIERLLSEPRRLIVTILIGNELVNVTASVISAAIVIKVVGAENSWLNIFIMVPVLLLFGEITPKTLAIHNNVAFASFQARYIDLFARAITPLRRVVRVIAEYFITYLVGEEKSRGNILTEDMVRSLTQAAVGEGALHGQEAKYIHKIFDLGDKTVRDLMTVRSQIFSLPDSMPLSELVAEIQRAGHTKIPITESGKDSVIGILFVRDLLGLNLTGSDPENDRQTLHSLLRKPYFVPELKKAAELFLAFRKRKISSALVADEFGGVTGLITMEDLLECIFGDIPSRSEISREQMVDVEVIGPNRYRVPGAMTIKQFSEATKVDLPETNATTIGGLLLNEFGEVPLEGAKITINDCRFIVSSIVEQRVYEVEVEVLSDHELQETDGLAPSEVDRPHPED